MAIDADLARKSALGGSYSLGAPASGGASGRHYMNPAYAKAMEPPPDDPDASGKADADVEPIGTKLSGYAGADQGPFKCANCVHFASEDSGCEHPVVVSDPEVEKNEQERAVVEKEGCCNFFRPVPKARDHHGDTENTGESER